MLTVDYTFNVNHVNVTCCREDHDEKPFLDIISYNSGSGRMDIRMSSQSDCADDSCFDNSKLVFSTTYDPLTESADEAREDAHVRCTCSDDYFVKYECG